MARVALTKNNTGADNIMKLPKLPTECIQRLITEDTQERSSLEITRETILAMVLGLSNFEPYTIEELDKLGILTTIIDATLYMCNKYNLTKETLELFDEIKSNTKALNRFISQINSLGQNLLKDPGVKQYILDTLIGPEWRQPDFYACGDSGLRSFFDQDLIDKKDIGNILCNELCIFDDIPEDRINKFYNALRRLKPYFKRVGLDSFLNFWRKAEFFYKFKDFPITVPEHIQRYITMKLEWYIEDKQLAITRIFESTNADYAIPKKQMFDFLKQLKERYPRQIEEARITKTTKNIKQIYWYYKRKYSLPPDLEELVNATE